MARPVRKSGMKKVPLSEIKDDLSRYLREAEERARIEKAGRVCAPGRESGWRI